MHTPNKGRKEKLKSSFPVSQYISVLQLPPSKILLFPKCAQCLCYLLHHLLGTIYKQVCLDFKLIHVFNSLFCSPCSFKFFKLLLIGNYQKTTEANLTLPPVLTNNLFTLTRKKFTCLGSSDLFFSALLPS